MGLVPGSSTLDLTLDGVTIRYGDVLALDDVTARIPLGTSVAVLGPNGSGKSTLLKAIAGLLPLSSGTIDCGRSEVAIVLQSTDVDPSLPLTVADSVAMARYPKVGLFGRFGPADRDAVDLAIRTLDLGELVDRQIHHLSGGQRQRTFVAQGLAQDAPVLLLDEPITGLDIVSRSLITEALDRAAAEGRTTILTTHSFAEAEQCDQVMLLSNRCIAFGAPDEVLTESNLQEAFGGRFVKVGDTLVLDDPHHEHEHAHH